MTTTTDQFRARTLGASDRIEVEMKRGVGRASLVLKNRVLTNLRTVSGGDLRLSGVGRKGAKVGVRYDVKGTKNPTSLVRVTGPVHLVERSTKAHTIKPKVRGRRGARALATPYGPRASVRHPGTRGKEPWKKAVDAAMPAVRRELHDAFRKAIRSGFKL